MNRITAVAATLATAALAATATIVPALAAPRPAAAHTAAHAKAMNARTSTMKGKATAAQRAEVPGFPPTVIASDMDGGKYVTIVHCQGVDSPPPIHLARPGTPLMVNGGGQSAAVFKLLKQQDPYKNIYTCTVLVKEKVPAKPFVTKKVAAHRMRGCELATGVSLRGGVTCAKKVTLDTGFGGLAQQVRNHRPVG